MATETSAYYSFRLRYGFPPADWQEMRIRDAVDIVGGGTPDSTEPSFWDGDVPWLTPTEMTMLRGRFATTSIRKITQSALENCNCRLLPVRSLVLSTRGTIGLIAIAGVPLTCNQSCEALLPKNNNNSDYLYYLLCLIRPILERFGAGTTFTSITRRDFRDIRIGLPNPDEQATIAKVLIAIDETLAGAEARLSAALRLKSALHQQLFTVGLPGKHTRYKMTPIGEIPEEWEVSTVGKALDRPPFSGVSPQSRPDPPGTPILNVECIDDGICTTEHVSYVDVDATTLEECRAEAGDFFVLRGNGNREYVATGGLLSEEPLTTTIFSDKLIRLRFKDSEIAERFMPYMWQSHSFLRRLQSKAESGSGLWMMSKRDIRRELFAKPPLPEQGEIVSLIDAAIRNVAACRTEVRAIEQLKCSLLQNLLTGKVRVRI
jgi:type I restriction enzyme S subunit